MSIPYRETNDLLIKWASRKPPIEDFTVENVLHALNLDNIYYQEMLNYLMRKSDFELIPLQMLLCPNGHKGETFPLDSPIDEEEIYDCWCGELDHFHLDNLILVFQFTEEFKRDAIGSEKKKLRWWKRNLVLI
ncbi:hypothetical protein V5F90_03395 [Priestia aryabhattai]